MPPTLYDGAVAIPVDAAAPFLIPTIGAALALERRFGDLSGAETAVRRCDLSAMEAVAGAGMGDAAPENLGECLFEAGLLELQAPLIEFLAVMANGGVPLPAAGEAGPAAASGEPGAGRRSRARNIGTNFTNTRPAGSAGTIATP